MHFYIQLLFVDSIYDLHNNYQMHNKLIQYKRLCFKKRLICIKHLHAIRIRCIEIACIKYYLMFTFYIANLYIV